MFRLIIAGKSEAIAKEAAAWAVSNENKGDFYEKHYEISGRVVCIKVFPIWIDQKGRKPVGDGLLLIPKSPDDLNAMEPLIETYKSMPIKFVLYDGMPEQSDFEAKWNAKPLSKGVSTEFVEKIITANNELVKHIASVFKNFDKTGKGKIEVSELKKVTEELGDEALYKTYVNLLKEFGKYKNAMVSLEEFVEVMKTGGKGNSSQIGMMIKNIIEENPLIQNFLKSLKELKIVNLSDKLAEWHFEIFANKITVPGVSIEVSLMTSGNALNSESQLYSNTIGLGNSEPFIGIAFESNNPTEARSQLEEIINTGTLLGKTLTKEAKEALSYIDFKFGSSSNKALMCVVSSDKGASAIDPIISLVNSLSNLIIPNQIMTTTLSFAADLERVATEDRAPYEIALDGVSLVMKGSIHPEINAQINQLLTGTEIINVLPGHIGEILPQLMLLNSLIQSGKGELEFDINQNVRGELSELIYDEEFKTPLKAIIAQEKEHMREEISSVPLLELCYNFLKDQVTSIGFFVYFLGLFAIKIEMKLPGLSAVLNI